MDGIVVTDLVPAVEEPELTSTATTGPGPAEPTASDDSDGGDDSAASCPWSLSHEQQVHNLKENLERALCWAGVLFNFEQHFELNPLLATVVSQLRNYPCLDSYEIELEKPILRHFVLVSKMTSLDLAILMGDLKIVQEILERGTVPVNVICKHDASSKEDIYYTPLHLVIAGGDSHIVDVLLEKGANVNAPNWLNQTPLDLACKKGNVTMLQQLLAKDNEGKDPLHVAVRFGDINFIQSLPSLNVNAMDHKKETPLHLAIEGGDSHIVDVLLEKGADVNAPNWLSQTPLDLACKKGNVTMLQQLLAKDNEGKDPLHVAVRLGDINFIQSLPSLNVNAMDHKKKTPLHLAIEGGDSRIVDVLLEKGANVNAPNWLNQTPLDLACKKGNVTMLQKLLVEDRASCPWSLTQKQQVKNLKKNWKRALYWTGAQIKLQNNVEADSWFVRVVAKLRVNPCLDSSELNIEQSLLGQFLFRATMNSLDLAILMGDRRMVQKILESNSTPNNVIRGPIQDLSRNRKFLQFTPIFDPYTKTGILYTPLHFAVEVGDIYIVDVLLEKGADVNAPNWLSQTPLDLTCKKGNVTMLQQLLTKDNEGKDPLHVAVRLGDINFIQSLPSLNVNAMDHKKETPLHLAIEGGDSHIVDVLLEKGANVNALNWLNQTPLDLACKKGNVTMLQQLLAKDNEGKDPLHVAVRLGDINFIQSLPSLNVNAMDHKKETPLHLAIEGGDSRIVDVLLEKGADVHAPNSLNQTPLDLACKKDNVTMLQQLLTKDNEGKDPLHVAVRLGDINFIQSLPSLNVNAMDHKKETPLHLAIEGGDSHIVNVLLEKGADVNAPNWLNQTPLDLACKKDNVTMLQQLLEKDNEGKDPLHVAVRLGDINFIQSLPSLNVNAMDHKKDTPLHLAIEGGDSHIVDVLLEKGADVNAPNSLNQTPLDLACKKGNVTMLQQLLEKDNEGKDPLHVAVRLGDINFIQSLPSLNVNAMDHKKDTPLHLAIEGGDSHIVAVLLEKGANVNAPNWLNQTPLDLACKKGNVTMLQQLLTKDNEGKDPLHVAVRLGDINFIQSLPSLNVNAMDHKKETPLHLAIEGGDSHIVDVLLEKGADVNAPNWLNQTPLDLACKKGNVTMLQQLLAKDNEGKDPLHVAVRLGDINFIQSLPSLNVNAMDHKKETPLHLAIEGGDSHIVDVLLEKGADVNAPNWLNQTPLDLACKKGNVTMLQQLLAKDNEGKDPLHVAVRLGDINFIQSLPSLNVNAMDHKQETPLHLAIEGGDSRIVDVLLEKGADVHAPNSLNQTPLDLACMKGNVTMLQKLLVEDRASCPWSLTPKQQVKNLKENWKRALYWTGAQIKLQNNVEANSWFVRVVAKLQVNPCLDSSELNIKQSLLGQFLFGATMNSLDLAILMADPRMVQKILESNSTPDNVIRGPIQDLSRNRKFLQLTPIFDPYTKTGILYTPLHLAVEVGDSHIVDVLLEKGADVNATNWLSQTPLDLTCKKGNVTMLQQLLAKDNEGKDPLHVAVQLGDINFIQSLPSLNVNAMDHKKETPLHLAIEGGDSRIVDVLLEKGANVNAPNWLNQTPLDLACKKGNVTILQQLLAKDNEGKDPLHIAVRLGDVNYISRLPSRNVNVVDYKKETPLHLAIEGGDSHIVDVLLEKGADVNAPNWLNQTPLDLACKKGNVTMLQQLLTKDNEGKDPLHVAVRLGDINFIQSLPSLNVNAMDHKKETPLHLAIEGGDSHIVDVLLEKGADVNAPNSLNQTPLDLACKKGNVTMLQQLLAKDNEGKDPLHVAVQLGDINFIQSLPSLNVNAMDHKKETPLHLAIEGGDSRIVDVLLEKGADVNTPNWLNQTPLDLACKKEGVTMLEQLLVHLANLANLDTEEMKSPFHIAVQLGDVNYINKMPSRNVNVVDYKKETPLHLAIEGGDSRIVDVLLEKGADVNAPNSLNQTPLDLACKKGNVTMLQQLLAKDNEGKDPLHVAVRLGDINFIQSLPSLNVNAMDHKKETPLHLAIEGGDSYIVDVLLKNGADVNVQNSSFETPLDLACKKGNVTMLQQLLAKDNEGKDPLHVAVQLGDINFIQSLPSLNVNAMDHKKETPLHLAIEGGDSHIVNVLLEKGADVNVQNSSFETPLDLACKKGNVTMLQQLLAKDNERKDPLHVAVRLGDINFIQSLPSLNVNAMDHKEKTPLHYLATRRDFLSSHVTNIVNYLSDQDKTFDMKVLDSRGLSPFYVAILYCNTQFVIALLDSFENQIRLNEACDKDFGPPIQIAIERGDKFKDIQRVLMECDRVKSYIENLYRDRQVYIDAANAILVGAALIASVTFASWLQPPLNYTSYSGEGYSSSIPTSSTSDLNYVDVEHNIALRAFWVFNALSFYFAIGTVVCGARSVLPRRHLFIKKTVDKLRTNLLITSTLLACSMLFVIIAFAIAGTIVLTPLVKYQWCMIVPTIVGGMVCIISLGFLVKNMVENCFNTRDSSDRLNKKDIDYLREGGYPFWQ